MTTDKKEQTTTEELLAMKTKIDAARTEEAKLQGSLAASMKRLKELGYDSVEAAEKHLDALTEQIADLDAQVAKGIDELHTEYGL